MKLLINFISFAIGFIIMAYEFVAARVLASHFGGSLMVWGALISVIMGGLCLGSIMGAKCSQHRHFMTYIPSALLMAGLSIAASSVSQREIIGFLAEICEHRMAILTSSVLIYFVPAFILGLISPLLVQCRCELLKETGGYSSGLLSGISTFGSICGTLFVSFYWMAAMGLMEIGITLSVVLFLLMIAAKFGIKKTHMITSS